MKINIVKVGYLECNCYILEKENQILIIDPGDDYFKIKPHLKDKNVLGILITHSHPDHINALNSVLKDYQAKVYEYKNLEEKEYEIGPFKFKVLYTKGHTLDCVSFNFYEDNIIFTGDFLFKDTIGRVDFPNSSPELMLKSIQKIKEYKENFDIFPGHGPKTNLDYERKHNPYFQDITYII